MPLPTVEKELSSNLSNKNSPHINHKDQGTKRLAVCSIEFAQTWLD